MKQASKTPNRVKTVSIEGQDVKVFVADLNAGLDLSVVSSSLLMRLAALLPTTDTRTIARRFADKVSAMSFQEMEPTIEEFVQLLQQELEFHKSINMINAFFQVESEDIAEEGPKETMPSYNNNVAH